MIRCAWGHDVEAPRLELDRPLPPRALGLVRAGCRHWRAYFERRHRDLGELARTYRGRWTRKVQPQTFYRAWKRSESAELHCRLGQLLLVHVDVATGEVGQLDAAGVLQPFRYGELAERLACSIGQLKRAIRTFRAAGYIWRHQGRDHDPGKAQPWAARVATIRVLRAFWSASGIADLRDRWVRKRKRQAEADAAAQVERQRRREIALRERIRARLERQRGAALPLTWDSERLITATIDQLRRRRPPPE